jgi:hypothetical protein
MTISRLLLAALTTASLAACAGSMSVVSASSDAVTIRHAPDRAGDADRQANSECDRFGKKGRLRSRHPESTNETFAIFDCIPK